MERDTFIFRKKWYEAIKSLDDKTKAAAFDCICQYALYHNTDEPTEPMVRMAMAFIVPELEADCEKWLDVKGKRSEAGKKGGAPKGNQNASKQNQAKQANDSFVNQNQAKQAVYVDDNVYVLQDANASMCNNSSSSSSEARARLSKWIAESDLQEWAQRQCYQQGLPNADLNALLDEFYNGDISVREECARSERLSVLKHFQNWLPKFLKAIKQESNGSTTTKQRNGSTTADLAAIAESIRIGCELGRAKE